MPCGAARRGAARRSAALCGAVRLAAALCGALRCGAVWLGAARRGAVQLGAVQLGATARPAVRASEPGGVGWLTAHTPHTPHRPRSKSAPRSPRRGRRRRSWCVLWSPPRPSWWWCALRAARPWPAASGRAAGWRPMGHREKLVHEIKHDRRDMSSVGAVDLPLLFCAQEVGSIPASFFLHFS